METLPLEILFIIYSHFDDTTLQNIKLVNKFNYNITLHFQDFLLKRKIIQNTHKKLFINELIKHHLYPYNIDIFYLTKFDIIILKFKVHVYLFEKVIYSKYNSIKNYK